MKKCRTYDCADAADTQKKVGDYQKEYDEKNTNKSARKSPGQEENNHAIEQEKQGKINEQTHTNREVIQWHHCLNVFNLSGEKDSTAALILMIERGLPIDVVFNADTGMEFPEMYEHLAKVDEYLYRERGLHITTLRHPKGFEWLMFEEPKKRPNVIQRRIENHLPLYGNSWSGIKVRWCTGALKTKLIDAAVRQIKTEKAVLHHIGIAADEEKRCKDKQYPLVEWGITEAKALQICYDHGFDFGGLYEKHKRASCYCCPFQRILELQNLRKYHPQLWKHLLEMDQRAREQFGSSPLGRFKQNWSVEGLDKRFAQEEKKLILP